MNSAVLIWVYVGLLIGGGLMGLIKAGSKASIIASCALAIPLVIVNLGHLPLMVAYVDIGAIGVLFLVRYLKSKKPMPAIPMIVASVVVLALLLAGRR